MSREYSTVMIPAMQMAIPLIAPCVSPSSSALDVPTAWLLVPMARPAAMGLRTRNSRMRSGAKMAPNIPVKMTAATVTGTMPPFCHANPKAIGVVTDIGNREAVNFSSREKA